MAETALSTRRGSPCSIGSSASASMRRDRGRDLRRRRRAAAAQRGLSVALLEADDFAAGTSSRSSKLIHGGLRYLAMGDVALVRKTALERKEIFRIAPHLAERRWMVVPARSRAGLLKFRAGDHDLREARRGRGRGPPPELDAEDLAREEPALDRAASRTPASTAST